MENEFPCAWENSLISGEVFFLFLGINKYNSLQKLKYNISTYGVGASNQLLKWLEGIWVIHFSIVKKYLSPQNIDYSVVE